MNKHRRALLVGIMMAVLILVGCRQAASTPAPPEAPPPAPEAPPEVSAEVGWGPMAGVGVKPDGTPYIYGYDCMFYGNPWLDASTGVFESWCKRAGAVGTSYNAELKLDTSTAILEALVAQQVDGIMIEPVDSTGDAPAVEAAIAAGIPVFNIDHGVKTDKLTCHIEHSQKGCAYVAAEYLVNLAKERNEVLYVYELWGAFGNEGSELRHQAFHEVVDGNPLIVVTESGDTQWSLDKGMEFVATAFPADPKLNVIFSHDTVCVGAVEALRTIGRLYPVGDPRHVPIFGTGEFPTAVDYIREGYIDGVAAHSPWEVVDAMVKTMLLNTACGLPVARYTELQTYLVMKEDLNSPRWGQTRVWGDMVRENVNFDEWPLLDLPAEYGIVTPTVDMKRPGY